MEQNAQEMAMVVEVNGGKAVLQTSAGLATVPVGGNELDTGDAVFVNPGNKQIIGKCDWWMQHGPVVVVKEVGEKSCTVFNGQQDIQVRFPARMKPIRGDKVMVDQHHLAITKLIGKGQNSYSAEASTVSWDDIGGQELAKDALQEAIEIPAKYPKLYKEYGMRPPRGILLYGPPGTGKTMLGKAASCALAKVVGKAANGFMYIKGPEVLDKFIGVAEERIRSLFSAAREHQAQHGYPAVIFIDEADALLAQRGTNANTAHLDRTIVTAFLAEMDGMNDSGAIVILATNRQDQLDAAVVREGRIDRKIEVGRPNKETCRKIFELQLAKTKVHDLGLAELATECLWSEQKLAEVHFVEGKEPLLLRHIASGALIASIVERASMKALMRDAKAGKAVGIKKADVELAVEEAAIANRGLRHVEAVHELAGDRQVLSVEKAK
ncbi:MAG: ATP-binding protein [Nitrospira sp.]|nr:ATP-binding protein [Nitrospira sp.]